MSHSPQVMEARSLIRAGLPAAEAAELAGCSVQAAQTRGASLGWIPTPDQIRERATQVRAKWSKAEAERRRVGPVDGWSVPQYRDAG